MTDSTNHRVNSVMWLGAFLFLALLLSNMVYFATQLPGESALPWINLILAVLAVTACVTALVRSQREPELRRGRAAGWVLSILSVLLAAFSFLIFYGARKLPSSSQAPQVGQKAPEFNLKDTKGTPVSLDQLLSSPLPGATEAPKAVLLIFYRGYW